MPLAKRAPDAPADAFAHTAGAFLFLRIRFNLLRRGRNCENTDQCVSAAFPAGRALCGTFFVEGVEIEVGVPDALPRIREDVDVVRMHRLSLYILIVAIVVLLPGEVAQEPEIGGGLESRNKLSMAGQ
jgi:hypothetical protein